jgi:CRISPR-associated protein Csd1
MSLDENNPSVPYRLGRLFAVLEKARHDAGYESSPNDYDRASIMPLRAFPIFLRRKKTSAGERYDKLIGEIMSCVENFPERLSCDDQGVFAFGYRHQKTVLWEKRVINNQELI